MNVRIAYLRIMACFMVIVLHISGPVFIQLNGKWWAGNFYDSLVRSCVPLFLMIAGATLLTKNENIFIFLKKRFVRIIPPLIFWSLFYLFWNKISGQGARVYTDWLFSILMGPQYFHLWYFYALIGVYFFVSIARYFFQYSSRQEKWYFLLSWFLVSSILPLVFGLLPNGALEFDRFKSMYQIHWLGGYLGYLVLGAWAVGEGVGAKGGVKVFLGSSLCIMVGTWGLTAHFGSPNELLYHYTSPFVIVAAYGLFRIFMSMNLDDCSGFNQKIAPVLSECTLGIFCIHIFVIEILIIWMGISVYLGNPWITIPILSVFVFLISFLLVFVFRLIRPLRYFV